MQLEISKIRMDGGTQTRAELSHPMVAEYAVAMENGEVFPPVHVFHDGSTYWLADGFHRVLAAESVQIKKISCEVHQGTQRDAILFSVSANATHGIRRTNADKRRAVETLLRDGEWVRWSDRKIADKCGVGNKFVGDIRSLCSEHSEERTYETKHGTVATMNTSNIGKRESSLAVVDEDTGEEVEGAVVVQTTTKTERPINKQSREAITSLKREKLMSVEFRAAYQSLESLFVQEKSRGFAGETSMEAARQCVRMLEGILES